MHGSFPLVSFLPSMESNSEFGEFQHELHGAFPLFARAVHAALNHSLRIATASRAQGSVFESVHARLYSDFFLFA